MLNAAIPQKRRMGEQTDNNAKCAIDMPFESILIVYNKTVINGIIKNNN